MKSAKPWVEGLKIDPTTYLTWQSDVPRTSELTYWCLESGRLRTSEYFSWAIEHYGLAYIRDEFFLQTPDLDLWNKIKTVANWSPHFLPIAEWDGVVYVACVEPPQEIHWSFKVQYLLAGPHNLKFYWDQLHSTHEEHSFEKIQDIESSVSSISSLTSSALKEQDESPALEATLISVESRPFIDSEPVNSEVKPGFTAISHIGIQTPPLKLSEDLLNPSEMLDLHDSTQVESDRSFEAPEGLHLETQISSQKEITTPPPFEAPEGMDLKHQGPLTPPDLLAPVGLASDSGSLPPPPPSLPEILSVETPKTPPPLRPPPPKTIASTAPTVDPSTAPKVKAPPPGQSVMASNAKMSESFGLGEINSDKIAPRQLSAQDGEGAAIAWVFQQLKQHFKYSWVFYLNADSLQIYAWEASASALAPNAKDPILLNQPSLFRIVSRTRMPYHGHVVDSPINTGFFRAWGLKQTPPHVTAVPLIQQGHVIALLLSAGEKPTQFDQVLKFTEKMGQTIIDYFGKTQQKAS